MTNHIFTFWEPKENIPGHLELCLASWRKYLPDYEIVILDYSNLDCWLGKNYYPDFLYKNLSLPVQSDAIRCAVLKKYGGIWMDVDTIITGEKAREILENNADFTLIAPHICFIKANAESEILHKWERRIFARIKFAQKVLKYGKFTRFVLKYFNRRLYKRILTWNYLGNGILDRILSRHDYQKLERDALKTMPELMLAETISKPVKRYKQFYFANDYSEYVLNNTKGLLLLHNSWTPKEFRQMTKEEFLTQNNTLAKIFKTIL